MAVFRVSKDRGELDVAFVYRFLSEQSYWAKGIPLATLTKAVDHSLCFGGFIGDKQIAFARVVTDRAVFANLLDVFVAPEHRGKGCGKALMTAIFAHPDLQGLRRFTLATVDAHSMYAQFGFKPPRKPKNLMERRGSTPFADTAVHVQGELWKAGIEWSLGEQSADERVGGP
jgi:GNAT superfamily N-acetyltransferase